MAVPTPATVTPASQSARRNRDNAARARELAEAFERMAERGTVQPMSLNATNAAARLLDVLPAGALLAALSRRL